MNLILRLRGFKIVGVLERVEVRHYKSLKRVNVELESFNILVGPNSSGKSNFLDVLIFLRDMLTMEEGAHGATFKRARSIKELVWKGEGDEFEIRVDARLPEEISSYLMDRTGVAYGGIRYQVRFKPGSEGIGPDREELYLIQEKYFGRVIKCRSERTLFPEIVEDNPILPESGKKTKSPDGHLAVARRIRYGSRVNVISEVGKRKTKGRFNIGLDIDPRKSLLSVILEDIERFRASLWFKNLLKDNIVFMHLNTQAMRRPVPPDAPERFMPDGSNLAKVVSLLKERHPERFSWWLNHVRQFLSDIQDINVERLPENNFLYLTVKYEYSLTTPSWLLSDGTLRFLALSIISYLPPMDRVFIIEEPENGLHPLAVEGVFQSLKGAHASRNQVMVATHSPVFLAYAEVSDLLIFKKTPIGSTDIVRGSEHPRLREWKKKVSIDTLIASGIL